MSQYCSTCKSANCINPDHIKVEKAFTPENDGELSKVTQQMSKNLMAQLEDKEGMSKALNSVAAAAIAREAIRGFAPTEARPVRHSGDLAARAVRVEPREAMNRGGDSFHSCNACGTVHKSLVECPRCAENSRITEAKDWRTPR